MAFNVSYIYQAIDKFTPVASKIRRSVESVSDKANKASRSFRTMGQSIATAGAKLTAFATAPIALLARSFLGAAATMESMQVSFETMLGSADKAKKLMKDLVFFAAKTPFELTGIGDATKQLLAFGVPQEEIIEKLQMLGDIASSSDKISLSDMAGIFGKTKAKGKAMMEEIMQMADRGIGIIDVLSERFNVSKEAIFEMASKGKISFKMIEDSLKSMTSKGGIYHNMMIKQSKTLNGLFSTMKDVIFAASATMGESIVASTDLKDKMVKLSEWIEKMTIKFDNLSPTTKEFIVYAGLLIAVVGPLLIALGLLVASLGILAKGFMVLMLPLRGLLAAYGLIKFATIALMNPLVRLRILMVGFFVLARAKAILFAVTMKPLIALWKLFNLVLVANPIGLIVVAIATAIAGIIYFRKEIGRAIQSLLSFFKIPMPEWIKKLFGIDGEVAVKVVDNATEMKKIGVDFSNLTGENVFGNSANTPGKGLNNGVNGSLNGAITVRAEQGTRVTSASSMVTGIKGNLGMSMQNLTGATF